MNIPEIIKNAFIFPSKNLETLSIYAVLSVLSGVFVFEGVITFLSGITDMIYFVVGGAYIAIAVILGLIVRSISIQCIKTGIELEEKLPDFKWWASLNTGLNKVIITIFYFIIPAIIVVFIGLITNLFGNIWTVGDQLITQVPSLLMQGNGIVDAVTISLLPLLISLAITIAFALIIFLIFSFFQAMAEAKYAHTGSLKKALNIYSALKDLQMIGVGKVILVSIIIFVIVSCIQMVLMFICDHLMVLSLLEIVITPYLALFGKRSLGLLYSDIV